MSFEITCENCGSHVTPDWCRHCYAPEPVMGDAEHQQIHTICGTDLLSMLSSYGIYDTRLAEDIAKRTEAAYALGYENGSKA